VESLLLAAGGAAVGLALAYAAVRVVGRIVAERVVHVHAVSLEPRGVLATVLLTVSPAVLFGLVPALRSARLDLPQALHGGAGEPWRRDPEAQPRIRGLPVRALADAARRRGAPPAELPEPPRRGHGLPARVRRGRPGGASSGHEGGTAAHGGLLRPARRARG